MTTACQPINRPARYFALCGAPPSPMFPKNVSAFQKQPILATMETKNEGWKQTAQKHSIEYQHYTVTGWRTIFKFMTKTETKVINVYGEIAFICLKKRLKPVVKANRFRIEHKLVAGFGE